MTECGMWNKVSAQPLATETVSLIGKETNVHFLVNTIMGISTVIF